MVSFKLEKGERNANYVPDTGVSPFQALFPIILLTAM